MKPSPKTSAIAVRRASLVAVSALLGAIGAFAASVVQQPTYSARAVLTVPVFEPQIGAVDNDALGRPLDASRLARTYASLIVEDLAIVEFVSGETGRSVEDLTGVFDVANTPDTPLIEVTIAGSDADSVAAALEAFVSALSGPRPASPSIAPDSLRVVRVEKPVASSATGIVPAVPAGLVLGALIGVVAAIFWERWKPIIDTESEAAAQVGVPTRDIPHLPSGFGSWVLKRWAELAGPEGWVLIVACAPVDLPTIYAVGVELAESLDADAGGGVQPQATWPSPSPSRAGTISELIISVPYVGGSATPVQMLIRASYPPGRPDGFEPELGQPGLVVLAIARGTPASDVAEIVDTLVTAGIEPRYAILLD